VKVGCGIAFLGFVLLTGCQQDIAMPVRASGGDPHRGAVLMAQYGCGSCHVIPGVRRAFGTVGPPLDAYARSVYVAGVEPNVPDKLAAWIRHPQDFKPKTAMPDVGVSEADARDMAAYLYTLKDD
jgi:cytochrome c1